MQVINRFYLIIQNFWIIRMQLWQIKAFIEIAGSWIELKLFQLKTMARFQRLRMLLITL